MGTFLDRRSAGRHRLLRATVVLPGFGRLSWRGREIRDLRSLRARLAHAHDGAFAANPCDRDPVCLGRQHVFDGYCLKKRVGFPPREKALADKALHFALPLVPPVVVGDVLPTAARACQRLLPAPAARQRSIAAMTVSMPDAGKFERSAPFHSATRGFSSFGADTRCPGFSASGRAAP